MTDMTFLGFLALEPTISNDGYLGSILVLDTTGCPVEFRATYPVKPTVIQRTLYGDILEKYIGVELCGRPLVGSISHRLAVLIVRREFLLGVRLWLDTPVVFIQRLGEAIEVADVKMSDRPVKTRVDCRTGRFQPIQISAFRDTSDDLSAVIPLVQNVYSEIDLLEPFDRMDRALKALASQDKRFQ
jgi:hypothetical protein